MALTKKHFFAHPEDLLEDFHLMLFPERGGDLATDVYQDKDNVVVKMHIPGIDKEKLDITVDEDRLTVSGSRETKEEIKDKEFFRKEIRHGSFMRTVTLPCAVEKDKAVADYENGVLTVTLPKKKSAEPSKIKVSSKRQANQKETTK
jgi:HSP20 family protein